MEMEVVIQAVKVDGLRPRDVYDQCCKKCCFYECDGLDHLIQEVFNLPDCTKGYYYKVKENV